MFKLDQQPSGVAPDVAAQANWICDAQSLLNTGAANSGGSTRRTALKVVLGAGYAAAVLPVAAQTAVKTESQGLDVGEASIGPAKLPVYYAKPKGGSNLPVVLVVHEIFGVHEYIADVCRRFAQAGYLAIAPELYFRQGDAGSYSEIAKLMTELVAKVPDAQVMADLDSCREWASSQGGDSQRVGVTGFCWGGRITWLYCAHAKIKAGVAWYGRLLGDRSENTPKHPLDIAAQLQAPVLGLYGEKDTGISQDSVGKMKAALAAAANTNTYAAASHFVIYPDAPHAFHADYRPSFREAAAKDGWQQCLAWFKRQGV